MRHTARTLNCHKNSLDDSIVHQDRPINFQSLNHDICISNQAIEAILEAIHLDSELRPSGIVVSSVRLNVSPALPDRTTTGGYQAGCSIWTRASVFVDSLDAEFRNSIQNVAVGLSSKGKTKSASSVLVVFVWRTNLVVTKFYRSRPLCNADCPL